MSGPVAFLPDLGHWAPSDGRSHTLQQLSCTHDSCRSCRSCPTDYFELVKKTRRSKNLRYWGGTLGGTLPPLHLEEQMVNLHLEVLIFWRNSPRKWVVWVDSSERVKFGQADWGFEPFAVEQTFNALGLRCLQCGSLFWSEIFSWSFVWSNSLVSTIC